MLIFAKIDGAWTVLLYNGQLLPYEQHEYKFPTRWRHAPVAIRGAAEIGRFVAPPEKTQLPAGWQFWTESAILAEAEISTRLTRILSFLLHEVAAEHDGVPSAWVYEGE